MKTTPLLSVDTQKFDTAMLKYLTFLNLKQAVLENRPVTSTFPEFHTTRTAFNDLLTQDRNQAYTRLVEGIEGRMEEHDGGAYSTQLEKQVHDREVFLYNQTLTDILENVVKPLYNKTGDN